MNKGQTILIVTVLLIGLTNILNAQNTSGKNPFEEAIDVIQRAYDRGLTERYSEYEKYFRYAEKASTKLMDEGVPPKEAIKQVRGEKMQERIDAIKQYYQDMGATDRIIRKYNQYKDIIEPVFEQYGLGNTVYRLVPWRESTFNPEVCITAKVGKSNQTVKGMWQFIESTAEKVGLKVTKTLCDDGKGASSDLTEDERFDVQKSSVAAAKYFKEIISLLGEHGNKPELVLCAYHTGPGAVLQMIKDIGPDYWEWKPTEENRKNYGFGPHSYDYAPFIMAAAEMVESVE